jgi:hypothetical protein
MKKWNVIIFLLLCIVSCSVENEIYVVPEPGEPEEADVNILLRVPGEAHPSTYAVTATEENSISTLDILAFAKNGAVDTFCYMVTVDPAKITNSMGGTNGNLKDVEVKLKRYSDQLRLVLIANASSAVAAAVPVAGESMDVVCARVKFNFTGQWQTSPFVPFPMWGQSEYVWVQDPVAMDRVEVTLLRSLARVDIGVDVFASDPAIGFGNHFRIEHIYTYKSRSKGLVAPTAANYNSVAQRVTAPSVPSDATVLATASAYTVPVSNNSKFYSEIYLPETGATVEADRAFIVIGATYDSGPELFYRIDYVDGSKNPVALLRNFRYMLDIRSVSRPGFATKEEAAAARGANLEYELVMTDDNLADFLYDGQYFLGFSEGDIVLDDAASHRLYISTNYASGWSVTYSGTLFNGHSETSALSNFNVIPLRDVYMREGSITVKAGTLTKVVRVRQYASYTSSILSAQTAAATYGLYYQTANLDGVNRYTSGAYKAELIWEDVQNMVSVSAPAADQTSFTTTAAGGNALFGLYSPTNELMWTWHLWRVPNYDPNDLANQVNIKGHVFMDRNLGATVKTLGNVGSYGLMYQWGRKEPFPRVSAVNSTTRQTLYKGGITLPANFITTQSVTTFTDPLEQSHRNPTTFITSMESPYFTWAGVNESPNYLWADKYESVSSPYDPCPPGWQVPTASEILNALTPTGTWNYGQAYQGGLILPAAGGIDFSSGLYYNVGTDGYYWIAETSGVDAKVLHIQNGTATIENAFRANGYSVRCMKEKYDD